MVINSRNSYRYSRVVADKVKNTTRLYDDIDIVAYIVISCRIPTYVSIDITLAGSLGKNSSNQLRQIVYR